MLALNPRSRALSTDRGRQNVMRALLAAAALHEDPPSWFFDPTKTAEVFRQGILEALGRLGDPEAIQACARALDERGEMTTRQARALIRMWKRRLVEAAVQKAQEKSPPGELVISEALAKQAAAMARQARSHAGGLANALKRAVARAIKATVRDYRKLHPGTTREEIEDALAAVAAAL